MGKKLEGNGTWESSRMMLPQHKEQLLRLQGRESARTRPMLDEDEQQLLNKGIGDAMRSKAIVTITAFEEFRDWEIVGMLTKVDTYEGTLRIECSDGFVTVQLVDIIKIESPEDYSF